MKRTEQLIDMINDLELKSRIYAWYKQNKKSYEEVVEELQDTFRSDNRKKRSWYLANTRVNRSIGRYYT